MVDDDDDDDHGHTQPRKGLQDLQGQKLLPYYYHNKLQQPHDRYVRATP